MDEYTEDYNIFCCAAATLLETSIQSPVRIDSFLSAFLTLPLLPDSERCFILKLTEPLPPVSVYGSH